MEVDNCIRIVLFCILILSVIFLLKIDNFFVCLDDEMGIYFVYI